MGGQPLSLLPQVLQTGSQAPVQHTLKTQLHEDFTRHKYAAPPRSPGLLPASALVQGSCRAHRARQEARVRGRHAVPLPLDIQAGAADTGPATRHLVRVGEGLWGARGGEGDVGATDTVPNTPPVVRVRRGRGVRV